MANYILTNQAVDDLSGIWNYTFDFWSEKQADNYYNMLLDSCQELADEHLSGRNYPDIAKELFGLRVGQHIIFYRHQKKNSIEIVRILHKKMDLKNNDQE